MFLRSTFPADQAPQREETETKLLTTSFSKQKLYREVKKAKQLKKRRWNLLTEQSRNTDLLLLCRVDRTAKHDFCSLFYKCSLEIPPITSFSSWCNFTLPHEPEEMCNNADRTDFTDCVFQDLKLKEILQVKQCEVKHMKRWGEGIQPWGKPGQKEYATISLKSFSSNTYL